MWVPVAVKRVANCYTPFTYLLLLTLSICFITRPTASTLKGTTDRERHYQPHFAVYKCALCRSYFIRTRFSVSWKLGKPTRSSLSNSLLWISRSKPVFDTENVNLVVDLYNREPSLWPRLDHHGHRRPAEDRVRVIMSRMFITRFKYVLSKLSPA